MRRWYRFLATGMLLALAGGAPLMAQQQSAFVVQQEVDGSGIQAILALQETEAGLVVRGVASGLDPELSFFTLFYDEGSVAIGPAACLPSAPDRPPVVVGFWDVNPDGTATLEGLAAATLDEIGTASIRLFTPSPPRTLQACGEVVERDFKFSINR